VSRPSNSGSQTELLQADHPQVTRSCKTSTFSWISSSRLTTSLKCQHRPGTSSWSFVTMALAYLAPFPHNHPREQPVTTISGLWLDVSSTPRETISRLHHKAVASHSVPLRCRPLLRSESISTPRETISHLHHKAVASHSVPLRCWPSPRESLSAPGPTTNRLCRGLGVIGYII
jgi:hypothetical protein